MSIIVNKKLIIREIKFKYGYKTDLSFANFLGIAPTTLASWYSRGNIDYELIFAKCENINMNYLFTGTGSIFNDAKSDSFDINHDLTSTIKQQADTIKAQQETIKLQAETIKAFTTQKQERTA